MPDIGEGTAEAELAAWHVAVGDHVGEDQPLCDVMTDKATVEVTSPFAGTVIQRTGEPGQMLPVGSVILRFDLDEGGDDATELEAAAADQTGRSDERATTNDEKKTIAEGTRRVLAAPALRKRAADLGINLLDVDGSGPKGLFR